MLERTSWYWGEGEKTLQALIGSSDNYEDITGIVFMQDQKLVRTASRPLIQDLDALPLAAWHLIKL